MKDIMLKITGKQIPRDSNELTKMMEMFTEDKSDVVEFITSGKYSSDGKKVCISYDETSISGMAGCKTLITIEPGKVTMKRKGSRLDETIMEFEKGRRYQGLYATPYGNITMELLTNEVSGKVEEGIGTKLSIDYDISLKGLTESRNTLDIEVLKWLDNPNENGEQSNVQ